MRVRMKIPKIPIFHLLAALLVIPLALGFLFFSVLGVMLGLDLGVIKDIPPALNSLNKAALFAWATFLLLAADSLFLATRWPQPSKT